MDRANSIISTRLISSNAQRDPPLCRRHHLDSRVSAVYLCLPQHSRPALSSNLWSDSDDRNTHVYLTLTHLVISYWSSLGSQGCASVKCTKIRFAAVSLACVTRWDNHAGAPPMFWQLRFDSSEARQRKSEKQEICDTEYSDWTAFTIQPQLLLARYPHLYLSRMRSK